MSFVVAGVVVLLVWLLTREIRIHPMGRHDAPIVPLVVQLPLIVLLLIVGVIADVVITSVEERRRRRAEQG